jgi:hypothetical protein
MSFITYRLSFKISFCAGFMTRECLHAVVFSVVSLCNLEGGSKILWEISAHIFRVHPVDRSRIYPLKWWYAPPGLHSVTTMQTTVGKYSLLTDIFLLEDIDTLMTQLSVCLVIQNVLPSTGMKRDSGFVGRNTMLLGEYFLMC